MTNFEIKKQPAGFGKEQYVVYINDIRVGSADTQIQAEIVGMTHELKA